MVNIPLFDQTKHRREFSGVALVATEWDDGVEDVIIVPDWDVTQETQNMVLNLTGCEE